MTDQVFLEVLAGIAKEQLPKLTDKTLANLAKRKEVKNNPVTAAVVQLARNCAQEHGAEAAGLFMGKLEAAMKGDPKDLIALSEDMFGEDLTALADALQDAEAKQKREGREATVRLGRHLNRFARILSRALLVAAVRS